MDWLSWMNAALDYIEENLVGEIKLTEVARRAGCSLYNFQRIFSFIAGVPLSEYIRRRRLTMAAIELQNSSAKVIDLALKYGYDSPASFARAFQALHGVTPARAKQSGVTLRAYPRISFQISIKGVSAMNYRIEEKPAFRMVGTKERVNMVNGENFRRVPQFWNEVCRDGRSAQIAACSKEKPQYVYGVCAVMGEESFDYLIASMSDQEPPQGMEALEVPACTWAIFECVGAIPAAIQEVTQRIFTEWFPSSGYEHAEAPELEWYSVGDSSQMDYRSEIWMPVVKKSK